LVPGQRLVYSGRELHNLETLAMIGLAPSPSPTTEREAAVADLPTFFLALKPELRHLADPLPVPVTATTTNQTTRTPATVTDTGPGTQSAPASTPSEPEPDTDIFCRICHDNDPASGRLISPCRCKGSIGYIHVDCLNMWRRMSRNNRSEHQCDQCGYHYNVQKTEMALWISSPSFLQNAVIAAMILAVAIMGMPAYALGVHSLFFEHADWSPAGMCIRATMFRQSGCVGFHFLPSFLSSFFISVILSFSLYLSLSLSLPPPPFVFPSTDPSPRSSIIPSIHPFFRFPSVLPSTHLPSFSVILSPLPFLPSFHH
jgi:hypothetical protein